MSEKNIEKPKNLYQRICAIMGECQTLEKEGHNKDQNYRYLKESTVADHLRPLLARYGVVLAQSIESIDRSEAGKTRSGQSWWLTRLAVKFSLINADAPEERLESIFHSEGLDTQDKGVYKASTNAQKYFFIRTFCLGSDEDVEKDHGEQFNGQQRGEGYPKQRPQPQARPQPQKPAAPAYYKVDNATSPEAAQEWFESKNVFYDSTVKCFVSHAGPLGGRAEAYRVAKPTDPAPTPGPTPTQKRSAPAPESEAHAQISDAEIVDKATGEVIPETSLAAETRAKIEKLKGARAA